MSTTPTTSGQGSAQQGVTNPFTGLINQLFNPGGTDEARQAKAKESAAQLSGQIDAILKMPGVKPEERMRLLGGVLDESYRRDKDSAQFNLQLGKEGTTFADGIAANRESRTLRNTIDLENNRTENIGNLSQRTSDNEFRGIQALNDTTKSWMGTWGDIERDKIAFAREQLAASRPSGFDKAFGRILQGAALVLPFLT